MDKIRNALLFVSLAITISLLSPSETAVGQGFTDEALAPVGIYQVSVSAPESAQAGKAFDVVVSVTITGINETSGWYNATRFEGVASVEVSIVEAGITREKRIDTTMITNTNISMIQPSPVYVVNVTSIEHTFTFNSTFLNTEVYSLRILIKGFRWALVGLSYSYSDFYIEQERFMTITGTTALEKQMNDMLETIQQLNSTIDNLRQQMTTITMFFYVVIGIAVVGIVIGATGVFLIKKRP